MVVVVEEGMRIETNTGIVLGPHLEPDTYSPDCAPLYIYNRSLRFWQLCRKHMPKSSDIPIVVSKFSELEERWDMCKEKYKPRKYFLSQKLLCKQLCNFYKFECTILVAIHDSRRRAAQLKIYTDLFDSIKTVWRQECISGCNQNSINFVRPPSFHLQDGTSHATRSETQEHLIILARRWLSSLA